MMKGNIKIYYIVFVMCLFVVSFAYAYTQGNLNANVQYILVTDPAETDGHTVYTPECLDECHLVIKIKYDGTLLPSTININPESKSNFNWAFNKMNADDDIKIVDVRIMKSSTIDDSTYSESCNPYIMPNTTYMGNCTTIVNSKTKNVNYFDSIYKGTSFDKGKYYIIDIVGNRNPTLQKKESDIIPTIVGYEMKELAWWSSSWKNCRNFTINETSGTSVLNKPIEYNFTGLVKQADNDDFRIVNEACNGGGTEQPYQILNSTSDSIRAVFSVNLTSGINKQWSVYYNNTGASAPGYTPIITYRDDFEGASYSSYFNNSKTSVTTPTTSTDYAYMGSLSVKIINDATKYNSLSHIYGSSGTGGTWQIYARQLDITGSYQAPFFYENIDAGDYSGVGFSNNSDCSGCTHYSYRNNGARTQSTVDFITPGQWTYFVAVSNLTATRLFVQNTSILYTTNALAMGKYYIWSDVTAQTNYFDEFRYYKNVYDNASQTYVFEYGPQQEQDVAPPVAVNFLNVTMTSPKNASYVGNKTIFMQYLVISANISNISCQYKLNALSNASIGSCANMTINLTALNGQSIIITVNGTNSTGQWISNNTAINFTITNVIPIESMNVPANASYVGNKTINLYHTITHTGNDDLVWCWYKVDSDTNMTIGWPFGNTTFSITSLGPHNVTVCIRDDWGTIGCDMHNFTITNSAPTITRYSPSNTTYSYNTSVFSQFISVHSGADSIDKCWYKVNAGSNVTSCSNVSVSVDVGFNTITTCSNDTWGGGGCSQINFTILSPSQELNITVQSPSNTSYVGNTTINVNYFVKNNFMTLDECWYKFNSGTNTTISNCDNFTIPITSLGFQILNISVNATMWNSTTEFRNTTTIRFTITNSAPTTTNQIPSNTSYVGNTTVNYAFTVSHSGSDLIDKCWYKVDSTANVTTCNNGTFSITALGLHNFTSCSNDTWGAIGCSQINFSITNNNPSITIQGLANASYVGNTTMSHQFTVSHTGVDTITSCWYKVDSESNVTGCGNGTFTISSLGIHTYKVCARDSWNGEGCTTVNFSITNTVPTTTLNTPSNTTYYGNNSVEISYTISHSGADSIDDCWYKYDNTANVTLGGCLNDTLSTGKGWHNLTVCVNDTWNGVGCSQTNFTIISTLTIYAFDEETLNSITAFNITITNEVDFSQTGSANASGVAVFNVSADGTIKVIVLNTAYETRTYYLTMTNNTVLNAYLVLSTNVYAQQFLTKDVFDIPLFGVYITVMKWINTSWTTVAMVKSDDSGSASLGLVYGSNYYTIGSLAGYNNKTKSFTPSVNPVIFVFGTERIPDYVNWLKGAIEHECQTDITARTVNCTINDTIGIVTRIQLISWRRIGIEWASFCSPVDSSAPYFLNCTMESANRTYYYTLYATTDDGVYPIESDYMDYRNTLFDYGAMGLLLAFILFLSIPMIARWNPAIAMILSIGIIVLCYWIEFFNVSEMAIVSIVLVGGIIVVLLTRRET